MRRKAVQGSCRIRKYEHHQGKEQEIRKVRRKKAELEKGVGEFGKLLALPQGLLGHLQIFLGLDQAIEGLGYRKTHFSRSALDLLLLGLGAVSGSLGIVIGF